MMQSSGNLVAGRYELGERIARGDWGVVHAARIAANGAQVAIKFIDAQLAHNAEACARFFHGARVMASLGGQYTIHVLDVGSAENGLPFVVMERLDVETLRARVQRARALPLAEVAPFIADIAAALDALHARGLLHQDVKPDDVLIAHREGREMALLVGFSLAGPPSDGHGGGVLGTPYFLAPERIQAGLGTDARSDLWSLGVVAYFAATGVLPFEAQSMPELFGAILEGPMPVPSHVTSRLPPSFDAWFARACARDRHARFASGADLGAALVACLHHPTAGFGTPSHLPPDHTPCAQCGEPICVPPMVFCPNCGVRLTAQGPGPTPLPTNTAPVPPPAFEEYRGLSPEAAPHLGQFRPEDPPEPVDVAPLSQPTLALATDAYSAAMPPRPPQQRLGSQPTVALADMHPPAPPLTPAPPPSQPTLALSNVDSYAPSPPPPRPPSQPTLAVDVPEIPAAAVRPAPVPRMEGPVPAYTAPPYEPEAPTPMPDPPMPDPPTPMPEPEASMLELPRPAPRPIPVGMPPLPSPGPAAFRPPSAVPPPAAESTPGFDGGNDPFGASGPASSDKPAAWLFRARLGVWRRGEVLAAGFAATGVNAVAVTATRVVATRGGGWEDLQLDAKIDLTRVRAIRGVGEGAFFLLGAGGLVLRVTLEGACQFWGLDLDPAAPIAAAEITFYDALPEGDGALFVGERPGASGTTGILARGAARSVRIVVPGTPAARLRSMARIAGGTVVACGAGKLVAFEKDGVAGVVEVAPGELNHIVPNENGALVVGAGAYAFSVGPKLHTQLEEVQTTSDLVSLTAYEGVGWAGSARGARILRRSGQGVWTRLTGNLGTDAGVVALAATEREIRAVLDDGTLVTGTLGI